jgi:two-component system, chemotaxis family, response regulator Rcp1
VAHQAIEILMVEDNYPDVVLAQEAFQQAKIGNNLHVVEDGEAALDFLYRRGNYRNAARPDLILLDLNLPRKDGREVLAEIKADPDLQSIPVVVLTASTADEDILRVYDLQANCYITKPVDLRGLLKVVSLVEHFWLSVVRLPEPTSEVAAERAG